MVPSRSMIAPWGWAWLLRMCFLIMCAPSTMTRCFLATTLMSRPRLPLSAPAMTTTSSPFLTWNRCMGIRITIKIKRKASDHFGCKGNDLHEFLVAQLAGDGAENTGAARVQLFVNDDDGVAVKAEIGAVVAANGLAGAHHDCVHDFAFLDRDIRGGFLDVGFDNVADAGVTLVSAQNTNGSRAFGAGVVSHVENGADLEHKS